MTDLPQNQRVLGRTGARELSQDELSLVHGSEGGRPTSTLSRDPNGVPLRHHTGLTPNGPSQRSASADRNPPHPYSVGGLNFCFRSGFSLRADCWVLNALRFPL